MPRAPKTAANGEREVWRSALQARQALMASRCQTRLPAASSLGPWLKEEDGDWRVQKGQANDKTRQQTDQGWMERGQGVPPLATWQGIATPQQPQRVVPTGKKLTASVHNRGKEMSALTAGEALMSTVQAQDPFLVQEGSALCWPVIALPGNQSEGHALSLRVFLPVRPALHCFRSLSTRVASSCCE